jgi:hypothetical protein
MTDPRLIKTVLDAAFSAMDADRSEVLNGRNPRGDARLMYDLDDCEVCRVCGDTAERLQVNGMCYQCDRGHHDDTDIEEGANDADAGSPA